MKIFWIWETNTKSCCWSNKLSHIFPRRFLVAIVGLTALQVATSKFHFQLYFVFWHRATIIWILWKWVHRPAINPQQKHNKAQHIWELLLSSPLESPAMRRIAWLFKFFWWRKETFSMRWHRIDQESCYDNNEAKGGKERTQEKSGLKFRNTLHTQTQTQTHIWKQVHHSEHVHLRLPGIMRCSRSCFIRAHCPFRTFHTVQSCVKGKNCSCSCAPMCIDNQIQTQHQFYVSLQVEHDNINTPSDIVHYVGHCIISFMASYASFHYSWVLYHDYDCRGAEMLSASHYGRVKRINIPEEAESGVQSACVWADSPGRSECTNAEGFMRRLYFSFIHTFVFNRCMNNDWLLIRAAFLAQEQYIDSISACDRLLSPPCVGDKHRNTIFLWQHSGQAGQQAGRSRSFAWSHLSADLQAVCDRELRCLFRMRSA